MTKTFQIIALFISLGTSAQDSLESLLKKFNNESLPYISVEELNTLQNNTDFLLVDTRESEEFKVSKIKNAVYVGFDQFSLDQFTNFATDKNQQIIVYCSIGIRSEIIGHQLKKAGYTNVKNLYGGIFEWKNKNLEVIDNKGNKTEKVHAYSRKWGKWLLKGEKIY